MESFARANRFVKIFIGAQNRYRRKQFAAYTARALWNICKHGGLIDGALIRPAGEDCSSQLLCFLNPFLHALNSSGLISGPTSVSGSRGSPVLSFLTLFTNSPVNSSYIDSWI